MSCGCIYNKTKQKIIKQKASSECDARELYDSVLTTPNLTIKHRYEILSVERLMDLLGNVKKPR